MPDREKVKESMLCLSFDLMLHLRYTNTQQVQVLSINSKSKLYWKAMKPSISIEGTIQEVKARAL